jgi:hypothetical protein
MTRKRLVVGLIAVFVVLGILSFMLPYVGEGHSHLTKLFP